MDNFMTFLKTVKNEEFFRWFIQYDEPSERLDLTCCEKHEDHVGLTTLPKANMEVENGPFEDHFPLQTGGFPLPC